jgi:hypothetical protein
MASKTHGNEIEISKSDIFSHFENKKETTNENKRCKTIQLIGVSSIIFIGARMYTETNQDETADKTETMLDSR